MCLYYRCYTTPTTMTIAPINYKNNFYIIFVALVKVIAKDNISSLYNSEREARRKRGAQMALVKCAF